MSAKIDQLFAPNLASEWIVSVPTRRGKKFGQIWRSPVKLLLSLFTALLVELESQICVVLSFSCWKNTDGC